MLLTMLKSKLHRATVTDSNLNYVGSITIDKKLMENCGILVGEKVLVVNINNGARLETYVIEGEYGKGQICLNGAAARLVQPQDKVIIIAFGVMSEEDAKSYEPTVIFLDDKNQILEINNGEVHGEIR